MSPKGRTSVSTGKISTLTTGSNTTSSVFEGQPLQVTHSLRGAPSPLTTSAAAPRGPSLWSAHPGAAGPGSPGCSARSSAATERSRVGASLGARGGGGRPGPTFLLAPSGKALAGSAIWSCSFRASASLREAGGVKPTAPCLGREMHGGEPASQNRCREFKWGSEWS